jgi:hypothetical protein
VLSLRVFSFEHRGYDKLIVSVVDPSRPSQTFPVSDALAGGAFSLPLPGLAPAVCSATPCALTIRMDKRGPLLDSGWRQLKVSGLPSDGRPLVVRYEVLSGSNTAHATWAYFDDVNRAPTARIAITPPGGQLEGDFVFFDCGSSSDPDGDALTCRWDVSGASIDSRSVFGPYAIFNFPENDPSLQVTLSVSDGAAVVATSTAFASAGTLNVANAAPLVNALNAEVVQGGRVELVCRYLDFGVLDTHGVVLQVAGETLATRDRALRGGRLARRRLLRCALSALGAGLPPARSAGAARLQLRRRAESGAAQRHIRGRGAARRSGLAEVDRRDPAPAIPARARPE